MPTKFVNILEASKLRIYEQYLDSISYVLLNFLTLQLYKDLAPEQVYFVFAESFIGNCGISHLILVTVKSDLVQFRSSLQLFLTTILFKLAETIEKRQST